MPREKLFNIDRWGIYTAQKYHFKPCRINFYAGDWCDLTPKQRRRMLKKARKGDTSIVMW